MILTERLKINNQIVPIAGYSLRTPSGGIGQSLTIALVDPFLSIIPQDALISFEIGAGRKNNGGGVDYSFIPIISDGKLNGLNYSAGWLASPRRGQPNDVLEFTAMSPVADKLTKTPARPVTMYNPAKVRASDLTAAPDSLIRVLSGSDYEELDIVKERVPNLTFYQVLDRAYTNRSPLPGIEGGCGFSRVITNIENFPVDRVDFTLESGFHQPAADLYKDYEVDVFEFENVLYIIAAEFGLPPGFTPQNFPGECVIELSRQTETSALINAVILSYFRDSTQTGRAGEIPSIKIINDEPQESGEGETYVREETKRQVTTYKDINTGEIRRTVENWVETQTFAYRPSRIVNNTPQGTTVTFGGGEVVLILEERTSNTYSGYVKSGYSRYVNALYLNPDQAGAPYKFGRVEEEEAVLGWRADLGHPGDYEQVYSKITRSGLCLVETQEINETYPPTGLNVSYQHKVYTPILDAVETGIVIGNGQQTAEWRPIVTVIETLRDTGQNQSNVETRGTNHLTGMPIRPEIQSRPGAKTTFVPPFSVKYGGGVKAGTIRELIKDDASVAAYGLRKPFVLDVGKKLSPLQGRRIARQKLKTFITPPRKFEILLAGINFFYRRGLVLRPPLRSGYDNPVIVTGLTITGRGLHTGNALRDMRLEARELINAD